MAMLEVIKLGISFGGLRAVDDLSMKIEEGALVGLIGPNGAGKTTVFNMLTGVYRPTDGGIRLDNQNLIGKKPHDICKLGVARTFQNIRLFQKLTVLDNVKVALHNQVTYNLFESMVHLGSYRKKEKEMDRRALEILKVFDLDHEAGNLAANLPYGKQLIEHDMKLVSGICEYLYVLNFGKLLAEGTPKEVLNDPAVIKAYLGD